MNLRDQIDLTEAHASVTYDGTNWDQVLAVVRVALLEATKFDEESVDRFLMKDPFTNVGIDLPDGGFDYGPLQPGDTGYAMPWGMYWTRGTVSA